MSSEDLTAIGNFYHTTELMSLSIFNGHFPGGPGLDGTSLPSLQGR